MNSPHPFPLEEFLLVLLDGMDTKSLWKAPQVALWLESLPEHDQKFHIERTTAAKGPFVLYYPLSAWHQAIQEDARRTQCVLDQYKPSEHQQILEEMSEMEKRALLKLPAPLEKQPEEPVSDNLFAQSFLKKP